MAARIRMDYQTGFWDHGFRSLFDKHRYGLTWIELPPRKYTFNCYSSRSFESLQEAENRKFVRQVEMPYVHFLILHCQMLKGWRLPWHYNGLSVFITENPLRTLDDSLSLSPTDLGQYGHVCMPDEFKLTSKFATKEELINKTIQAWCGAKHDLARNKSYPDGTVEFSGFKDYVILKHMLINRQGDFHFGKAWQRAKILNQPLRRA